MSQIQPKPNFSSQSKVFSHYLLGMSADAVVGSFCQCSHLALTATQVLGEHTSPGPSNNLLLTGPKGFENNASFHDSQSPAISIKNKLSYTVENLACAIHCLALIAEDNLRNPVPMNQAFNAVDSILRERREQANGWITSLRGCVKAAQLYPLHSFIHNVLRVVQDFDGNNTYQTPYGSRPVETLD